MDKAYNFEQFCGVIEQLRGEHGCPWDKKQTHSSLKQCLIEEAYEVIQAIDDYEQNKDYDNLREELGDVLLQVVMHSVIAKEEGIFTIDDVIDEIAKKMVRRHPHVFSDKSTMGSEEVTRNWDEIKKAEKSKKNKKDDLLSIPVSFPALIRAQKVIKKSDKLRIDEIQFDERLVQRNLEIILDESGNEESKKNAFGGLLFEICKLGQIEHLNAENCLFEFTKEYIRTKE